VNTIIRWIAAAALALLLATIWDQPTEIEATEAIAAEVAALTGGGK